ncbi:MAG: hypothetical protein QM820_02430 [Minicystis sp.]
MRTRVDPRFVTLVAVTVGLSFHGLGCEQLLGLDAYKNVYCIPGKEQQSCYTGPAGTQGKGKCRAGMRTCLVDGSDFGPCEGEVLPDAEDDCSDRVCEQGEQKSCYDGPPATLGIGICKAGTQTCAADGLSFGPCVGAVEPDLADQNGGACSDSAWSEIFGDVADQQATAIAADVQGGVFIGGPLKGAVKFGTQKSLIAVGNNDYFVAKFDSAGTALWAKKLGDGSGGIVSSRIAVDSKGNVVLAGQLLGTLNVDGQTVQSAGGADVLVVKLDAAGAVIWAKAFGGASSQSAWALATDSHDDVIVAGSFTGSLSFGGATLSNPGGGQDAFLTKLAADDGAHVWSKSFSEPSGQPSSSQVINDIAVDAADNILIVGSFDGSSDWGGLSFTSNGQLDIILAKYDASGNHGWSASFGGPGFDVGTRVAADSTGNAVMVGYHGSTVYFGGSNIPPPADGISLGVYVAKFGNTGTHQWSKSIAEVGIPLSNDGVSPAVVVGAMDRVIIAGAFTATADLGGGVLASTGGYDVYLGKLAPTGEHEWSKTFGDGSDQWATAVCVDPKSGSVLLTGGAFGAVDFGTGTRTSTGGADAFLAKVPTSGP